MSKVDDPAEESAEFCLDCYKKHVGQAKVLLTEALDRVRQDTNHQDAKLVNFIRLHANEAMDELASAEAHVNKVTKADEKTKDALDKLANETRVIRDQVRNYLKTTPNPKADNYDAEKQKILTGESVPRVDLLRIALSQAIKSREQADILSSEVGCGSCMASPEELAKVKRDLEKTIENEPVEIKKDIKDVSQADYPDILATLVKRDPFVNLAKNISFIIRDLLPFDDN